VTVVGHDHEGLSSVSAALEAGEAVLLPFPAPLPYAVAARSARTVNELKGRSSLQPVGVALADLSLVSDFVGLDEETFDFARWVSADQLCNVMLPVAGDTPLWVRGATSRGMLAVTLAWLPQLRGLLSDGGHLFVSSANRTGGRVATNAADADRSFGGSAVAVDGDAWRDQGLRAGSATILRLGPGLKVEVVREGINDQLFAGRPDGFVGALMSRWPAGRSGA
jgi:tRNA A37 threonylcarbamoyladenosine synthetase subunit TsaC/SUA5/YrdC